MKKIYIAQDSFTILGRTAQKDNILWLLYSAGSVSFKTDSKLLIVDFAKSPEEGASEAEWPRYAIFVQERQVLSGIVDCNTKTERIDLSPFFTRAEVCVKIVKLSEASHSFLGIQNIQVQDNALILPTEKKARRIEFIGDSITCGYGVDTTNPEEGFTTKTEDATKSYAAICAEKLETDFHLTSYSGFGIYSGWTENGKQNKISLVPRYYENLVFNWHTHLFSESKWDFSLFTPQVIVINLGTNDESYCKTEELCECFVQSYIDFLKTVRNFNKEAYIITSMGIMKSGDRMSAFVKKATEYYAKSTGDKKIAYFHFNPQLEEEGYGANFHPSCSTHKRCATNLADFINKLSLEGEIKW